MKKQYFSTFVHGLEKPVEAMLHKEGGVAVERIVPGAAIYRSVREPSLPFVHQTFSVLFQMKPVADVNDAIRRLLATGSWLDRFPYEETQGKRFRADTGQSVSDYMDSLLMQRLQRELLSGEATLAEIADELGFCDQFYMSRYFKKRQGETPSAYRRRLGGAV